MDSVIPFSSLIKMWDDAKMKLDFGGSTVDTTALDISMISRNLRSMTVVVSGFDEATSDVSDVVKIKRAVLDWFKSSFDTKLGRNAPSGLMLRITPIEREAPVAHEAELTKTIERKEYPTTITVGRTIVREDG